MKIGSKLIALMGIMLALAGCDSKLSKEDRQEIESLKEELAETQVTLTEHKKSFEADSAKLKKEIVFAPAEYQTETDKKFRGLANRIDCLEIYPLPDNDLYRVKFISNRSRTVTTKDLATPLSFFRAVYDLEGQYNQDILIKLASRGYGVEFIRLFDQGEFIVEKQAILSLYTGNFS